MLDMQKLVEVNQNIQKQKKEREQLVQSMNKEIISIITNKMDWMNKHCTWNISYGELENKIMVDVRLDEDPNARYVFSIGKSCVPHLEFREDFSRY